VNCSGVRPSLVVEALGIPEDAGTGIAVAVTNGGVVDSTTLAVA